MARQNQRVSETANQSTKGNIHYRNGFTALECMLVILIVVLIVQVFSICHRSGSLNLFAQNLLNEIQIEQFRAMSTRSSREIDIDVHHAQTEERIIDYPSSVTCSYQVLIFNARGNIAKGGTITCSQGKEEVHLVFQLGAGRGRIDHERK